MPWLYLWFDDYSELFYVSVLLLVPTMTFTRVVVVFVQLAVAGRACLDFRECLWSFSSSLRLLILCMEVCCSLMDMLEFGLRMPLHTWKELLFAWCMSVLKDCHLLQQWDWNFILIYRIFWWIPCILYLSNYSLQLPISLSLRYVHCFVSDLSSKKRSVIVIYIPI